MGEQEVAAWHATVASSLEAGHLASTPIVAFDPSTGRVVGSTKAGADLLGVAIGDPLGELVERQVLAAPDVRRLVAAIEAWRTGLDLQVGERAHSIVDEVRVCTDRGWRVLPVTAVVHRRMKVGGDVVVVAAEEVGPSAGDDADPDERSGTFWSMTDIDARVIAIDPRASVIWDDPDALIGTLTSLVTHPEDLAEVLPMAYELYNGQRDVAGYTVRVAASDGRWVPLAVELRRMTTADGSLVVVADNRVVEQARRVILPGDLTRRETEVVDALFDGLRVAQIAERQGVSTHTVRNQLRSIFKKLGVSGQADLTARCHRPSRPIPPLEADAATRG